MDHIMLQLEEIRLALLARKPELLDLAEAINYKGLGVQVAELEMKAAEPGFGAILTIPSRCSPAQSRTKTASRNMTR